MSPQQPGDQRRLRDLGPFPSSAPPLGLPWQFFHQCEEQISPTSWPSIKFRISVLLSEPLCQQKYLHFSSDTSNGFPVASTRMRDPCPSSPAASRRASTTYSNPASRTYAKHSIMHVCVHRHSSMSDSL